MFRPFLSPVAVALLCASATAQILSREQPITAPLQFGGTYHVDTGTWTNEQHSNAGLIYNNTCDSGYFMPMESGERIQHRSRLPTTAVNGALTQDSVYYGTTNPNHRYDKRPGCTTEYDIDHFQVAYCTRLGPRFNWRFSFAEAYTLCGGANGDMVPDPNCDFLVTGLPANGSSTTQRCWVIDIVLPANPPCILTADQDGTYVGPRDAETFGYSQGPAQAGISLVNDTGPIIAGNYTWTGGTTSGVLIPCTGADGTLWDNPINLNEEGTGMNSQDFFRLTGSMLDAPGCYFFGGQPHADFYLKLYSKSCPPTSSWLGGCFPHFGECPCANDPVPVGQAGCNNFGAGPVNSGMLTATGVASLASDTITLVASGENNTSTTVFWTGTNSVSAVSHGAGRRCTTANLKRLYNHPASGGNVSAPVGADLSVSARSAAVGAPISPGQTRYYFNIYRDPAAAGPCGNSSSTVNLTNGGSILWNP